MNIRGIVLKGTLFLALLCSNLNIFSQEQQEIDFYGVFSNDIDANMTHITEDLFFAQLKEMQLNATINDCRSNEIKNANFSEKENIDFSQSKQNSLACFIIISQKSNSKWLCEVNVKNLATNKIQSNIQEYDSFYKIMTETKKTFSEIFKNLFSSSTETLKQNEVSQNKNQTSIISADEIAGTWKGEEFVDRIVLLRSGKGFVIFKNGASMNVSVSIQKIDNQNTVNIKQIGGNNASYFPELSRKAALEYAMSAAPVEWSFTSVSTKILKGNKKTLIQKTPESIPEKSQIPVEWQKVTR